MMTQIEKKNGEFDIVTLDDRGYIFYEAKFRKEPVTENVVRNEIRQVEQTGWSVISTDFFQSQDSPVRKRRIGY